MPSRLCIHAGCSSPVVYRGYCQAHARAKEKRTRRAGRHIYPTAKWRHTRDRVLFEQPLCAVEGCGQIAVEVDHIIPLPDGAPYDMANLQGLCKHHHGQKTKAEQTYGVGWPD